MSYYCSKEGTCSKKCLKCEFYQKPCTECKHYKFGPTYEPECIECDNVSKFKLRDDLEINCPFPCEVNLDYDPPDKTKTSYDED